MKRVLIVISVGLTLFCPDSLRAQSGRWLPAFVQIQKWFQLAKAHQIGHIDEPLRTLASWSPAQFQLVNHDLRAIQPLLDAAAKGKVHTQQDPDMPSRVLQLVDLASLLDLEYQDLFDPGKPLDPIAIAKADGRARDAIAKVMVQAAMLETDLILASFDDASGIRLPRMTSTTILIDDAQRTPVGNLELFWDTARQAMDLAEPTPRAQAVARQWYDVTAEYLLAHRDYAMGVPHIGHARDVIPGDARLAFYFGTAYENMAAPGIQAAFEDGDVATMAIETRPVLLAKAEFQLRSALLLEPDFAEASLRLGHTLELLGRHDEALRHLQPVESTLPRPDLRYFTALFIGRAHEADGRDDEARAAFERAAKQFPSAQSPRLALARLALRTGGQAEALPHIRELGTEAVAADPWWTYDVSATTGMSDHFVSLRAAVATVLR